MLLSLGSTTIYRHRKRFCIQCSSKIYRTCKLLACNGALKKELKMMPCSTYGRVWLEYITFVTCSVFCVELPKIPNAVRWKQKSNVRSGIVPHHTRSFCVAHLIHVKAESAPVTHIPQPTTEVGESDSDSCLQLHPPSPPSSITSYTNCSNVVQL